ncbi:MAG: YwbE family protein [Methanosarcina sp.]|nr:YwbE family protein [Methanosarcina sp.]MDD3246004.1 YwbE family protein [Methanosarcina sp.]
MNPATIDSYIYTIITDHNEDQELLKQDQRKQDQRTQDQRTQDQRKQDPRTQDQRKQDQRVGKITPGVVKRILTNSSTHPHGIKIQLTDVQVGRVKEVY